MAVYALLDGAGKVTGLCSPADGSTLSQSTFLTAAEIASAREVPSGVSVGIGWVYGNGAFASGITPPAPPPMTLAQQAAAAILAGLMITLSGTVTLPATLFPTDPDTTSKIQAMADMAARGILPMGHTTYDMKDRAGIWHAFTAPQYQAVTAMIASYVAALALIRDGNSTLTALPDAGVSIPV